MLSQDLRSIQETYLETIRGLHPFKSNIWSDKSGVGVRG